MYVRFEVSQTRADSRRIFLQENVIRCRAHRDALNTPAYFFCSYALNSKGMFPCESLQSRTSSIASDRGSSVRRDRFHQYMTNRMNTMNKITKVQAMRRRISIS